MTSSVTQSPVVEPTTKQLTGAYETEISTCGYFDDLGAKVRSRPQSFCSSVAIAGTLDVASPATFAAPISVTGSVIVDGIPYLPSSITQPGFAGAGSVVGSILTANGLPIILSAPTPSTSTFADITVTQTADFNNVKITGTATGVFDAGSY